MLATYRLCSSVTASASTTTQLSTVISRSATTGTALKLHPDQRGRIRAGLGDANNQPGRSEHRWRSPAAGGIVIREHIRARAGNARRTVQEDGDATFGQADPPPLSEVPARVEEWDGERWVVLGEASSTEEMKRLLALPRAE